MGRIERQREIARRRTRRAKLKKLRGQYAAATSPAEREVIAQKVKVISPFVNLAEEAEAASE